MKQDLVVPALQRGVAQLEEMVGETERAAVRILDLVEEIAALSKDPAVLGRISKIVEACTFQDVTAQRARKVVHLLRFLEQNIGRLGSPGAQEASARFINEQKDRLTHNILDGRLDKSTNLNQIQIDRHFATAKVWD